MSEDIASPVKVGQLVDVLVASRSRAQGVQWIPARITAIEKHPQFATEKVYRIKPVFEDGENRFAHKWAYRQSSIRRPDVLAAMVEFANDEIEKINAYSIKYEYDTSLDPNDPPTPFNKDEFLKGIQALSELSQRAAGVGGDSGLVVVLPKGAPTRTVTPEEAQAAEAAKAQAKIEVDKMIDEIGESLVKEAEENRRKKGEL